MDFVATTSTLAWTACPSASAEEISPYAGVVDVTVLLALAYLAKLGNDKSARASEAKTKTSRAGKKK